MIIKRYFLLLFFLSVAAIPSLFAQEQIGYTIDSQGDTIYVDRIRAIYVFNLPSRKTASRAWREYYRTVYNFNKAYPYALIAKERILWADSLLAAQSYTSRERERVIRQIEKSLFSEFEGPLRKLTVSQGAMLMRLIDREVGQSTYYIIKNYRGGVNAGAWQGVARLFGSNLKSPYDRYGEDKILEELVHMYQQGSFYYLYSSIFGPKQAAKDAKQPKTKNSQQAKEKAIEALEDL